MSALKKTIDSEDEDDVVVQTRDRSRATNGHRRDPSEQAQLKSLEVNIDLTNSTPNTA